MEGIFGMDQDSEDEIGSEDEDVDDNDTTKDKAAINSLVSSSDSSEDEASSNGL